MILTDDSECSSSIRCVFNGKGQSGVGVNTLGGVSGIVFMNFVEGFSIEIVYMTKDMSYISKLNTFFSASSQLKISKELFPHKGHIQIHVTLQSTSWLCGLMTDKVITSKIRSKAVSRAISSEKILLPAKESAECLPTDLKSLWRQCNGQ